MHRLPKLDLRYRRAIRAMIVIPGAAYVCVTIFQQPSMVTFTLRTTIALLILADFTGTTRERFVAYTATSLLGLPVMVVAHVVEPKAYLSVIVMMVLSAIFAIAKGFGGFIGLTASALTMILILGMGGAINSPTPFSQALAGYLFGCAAATIGALIILPSRAPHLFEIPTAQFCRRVAALIDGSSSEDVATLRADTRKTVHEYLSDPQRPMAPEGASAAATQLLDAVLRLSDGVEAHDPRLAPAVTTNSRPGLRDSLAQVLRESADTLESRKPVNSVPYLRASIEDHREHADSVARQALLAGSDPAKVQHLLDRSYRFEAMGRAACEIAVFASRTVRLPDPPGAENLVRPLSTRAELRSQLRARLRPDGVLLSNALAAAVLFGSLVVLTKSPLVAQPLWVFLGALTALYGSARGTGRRVIDSMIGTALGFIFLSAFAFAALNYPVLRWLTMILALGVATLVPDTRIGFVFGQAAFTVVTLAMFTLTTTDTSQVGGVRVLDVAIGCCFAFLVAAVLSVRKTHQRLVAVTAELTAQSGLVLRAGIDSALAARPVDTATVSASRASGPTFLRAVDVLAHRRETKNGKPVPTSPWVSAMRMTRHIDVISDSLVRHEPVPPATGGAGELRTIGIAISDQMELAALSLRGGQFPGSPDWPAKPPDFAAGTRTDGSSRSTSELADDMIALGHSHAAVVAAAEAFRDEVTFLTAVRTDT